jgi:hypothetical protein
MRDQMGRVYLETTRFQANSDLYVELKGSTTAPGIGIASSGE